MFSPAHQQVLQRIRAEFLEMPGMRLTVEQVERLCGVEQHICQAVLAALVDAGFLRTTRDGVYVRFADDVRIRPRPARATLQITSRGAVPRRDAS